MNNPLEGIPPLGAWPGSGTGALGRREWLGAALGVCAATLVPGAARAAGENGAPLIRLALNENPLGPSPLAVRAVKEQLSDLSRYTSVEADELVRDIAAREHVAPEQVVLGEVLEALGHHLGSSGGSGGEFLYSNPGYTALIDAARAEGAVGVPVPLDAQLENDLPALRARLGPRTRAVFLVNPHNPSGTVSDPAALHGFIEHAARSAAVVVDEAYLEYTPDFAARTAVRHSRADGRVFVFRTFTKFYGLASLPLSFAIVPTEVASVLRKQGLGAPRSLNRLALVAARASLRDAAYAERVRRTVAAERTRWFSLFDKLGLRHARSAGNFVFFDARRPQAELARGFAERGIDIGRAFPPLDTWVRISIGLPAENARAQAVLETLLSPTRR